MLAVTSGGYPDTVPQFPPYALLLVRDQRYLVLIIVGSSARVWQG